MMPRRIGAMPRVGAAPTAPRVQRTDAFSASRVRARRSRAALAALDPVPARGGDYEPPEAT